LDREKAKDCIEERMMRAQTDIVSVASEYGSRHGVSRIGLLLSSIRSKRIADKILPEIRNPQSLLLLTQQPYVNNIFDLLGD
jgi:hypothetical protein